MRTRREFLAAAGVLAVVPVSALAGTTGKPRRIEVHVASIEKWPVDGCVCQRPGESAEYPLYLYRMEFCTRADVEQCIEWLEVHGFLGRAPNRDIMNDALATNKAHASNEGYLELRQCLESHGVVFTGNTMIFKGESLPPRDIRIPADVSAVTDANRNASYEATDVVMSICGLSVMSPNARHEHRVRFSQIAMTSGIVLLPLTRPNGYVEVLYTPDQIKDMEQRGVVFCGDMALYTRKQVILGFNIVLDDPPTGNARPLV